METENKPRKPRAPKPPAAPKSVEELVQHALKLAATNPKAKWTGTSAAALFNTKEANYDAAIAECMKSDAPLLKQVDKVGELTAAGFERIATQLSEEEVVPVVKAMAERMSAVDRVAFFEGAISRTPNTAAELTPLLEEAVVAKSAELEATAAAKAKQAAAAAANRAALERALELSKQDFQNEINAVKRQWEALGQKLNDLPAHKPAPAPTHTESDQPQSRQQPQSAEEKGFRREVAQQLAESWRAAWNDDKHEGRDYLEAAMWNVEGLRMIGEKDSRVAFNAREHECGTPAFPGDMVKIVRPGWLVEDGERDHIVIKALVEKV